MRNQILTVTMQPLGDSLRTVYITKKSQVSKAIQLLRTGIFCSPSNVVILQPFTIPLTQPYATMSNEQFPKNIAYGYRPHVVNKPINMVVCLAICSITGDVVLFDIWKMEGMPQILVDLIQEMSCVQAIWSLDNVSCIKDSLGVEISHTINVGKIIQQLYKSNVSIEKLAFMSVIGMRDMNEEFTNVEYLLSPTSPKKIKLLTRHASSLRDLTVLVLITTTGFTQMCQKNKIYKAAPSTFADWVNIHDKLLTTFQSSAQFVHSNQNKAFPVHILQFMLHAKAFLMSRQLNPVTMLMWEVFRGKIMSDIPEPWLIDPEMHAADQQSFDRLLEMVNIKDSIDHKILANGRFASDISFQWVDMTNVNLWTSFTTPDLLATLEFPEKKAHPCTQDEKLHSLASQLTSCLKIDKMLAELRKPSWPPHQLENWTAELPIEQTAEQLIDEAEVLCEVEKLEEKEANGNSPLSAVEILNASIGILNQSTAILARTLLPSTDEIQQRAIMALTARLGKRIDDMQTSISKLNARIDGMNPHQDQQSTEQSNNSSLESCLRDKG